MSGERYYTTKIWRQPSSIGFSSAGALSTSMDPPGEPVISTWKRPCQKYKTAQNFRNWWLRISGTHSSRFRHQPVAAASPSALACIFFIDKPVSPRANSLSLSLVQKITVGQDAKGTL